MKKIILEDNDNIHLLKFKLTFKPDEDKYDYDEEYEDDDETYFPDESDVEYALKNSMLDQDNDYLAYPDKITDKEAVFIIEVTNKETNEYMPTAEDIEHAMEYSGVIDEWNYFYAELISKTITRSEWRDTKLTEIGID